MFNIFSKRFEVIENKGELVITHFLNGKRKDVEKDIQTFKDTSKNYKMIGKTHMIVWR